MSEHHAGKPPHAGETSLDVRERGAERDGQPQVMDRRLFMQLLAFRHPPRHGGVPGTLAGRLEKAKLGFVVYEDVNDPFGIGLLTFSEDPTDFVTKLRPALAEVSSS